MTIHQVANNFFKLQSLFLTHILFSWVWNRYTFFRRCYNIYNNNRWLLHNILTTPKYFSFVSSILDSQRILFVFITFEMEWSKINLNIWIVFIFRCYPENALFSYSKLLRGYDFTYKTIWSSMKHLIKEVQQTKTQKMFTCAYWYYDTLFLNMINVCNYDFDNFKTVVAHRTVVFNPCFARMLIPQSSWPTNTKKFPRFFLSGYKNPSCFRF